MRVEPTIVSTDPANGPRDNIRSIISVDAMSGDLGPKVVVRGMSRIARQEPDIRFIVHGDSRYLETAIGRNRHIRDRCEIVHADNVVSMSARPSHVVRHGQDTSMWSAINSVREGKAGAVVSCGNTGALMAVSMLRLRRAKGVNRPAIACLWPSTNPSGFNVLLDVGADIRANPRDLLCYAILGSGYARSGLRLERPRVGLLNVGTERHKGRQDIRDAHDLISEHAGGNSFEYVGFVEGSDIPSNTVDVVVTDGFTGNIALKSVEGTAALIRKFVINAFRHTPLSRIATMFAYTSLRRLYKRLDPRRVNGGVFLGLSGMVVKSHGKSDPVAIEAALRLAFQLTGTITDFNSSINIDMKDVGVAAEDSQERLVS